MQFKVSPWAELRINLPSKSRVKNETMVNSCCACIVWNLNRSSSLEKSDRDSFVVSCNQFKLWRVDKSYHVEVKGGELRLDNFLSLKLHKLRCEQTVVMWMYVLCEVSSVHLTRWNQGWSVKVSQRGLHHMMITIVTKNITITITIMLMWCPIIIITWGSSSPTPSSSCWTDAHIEG